MKYREIIAPVEDNGFAASDRLLAMASIVESLIAGSTE
jgi:hypothetical protein